MPWVTVRGSTWIWARRPAPRRMDGAWANWEPFSFVNQGCMCDTCRREFAKFLGYFLVGLGGETAQGTDEEEFRAVDAVGEFFAGDAGVFFHCGIVV